ncbi:MAG: glycosyltransferase [Acidimicrobiales bacterium]
MLVTSTPGTGHLYPLVPIAAGLVGAGHEIVWATATESCARVEGYGFVAVPAGMGGAERRRLFSERAVDLAQLPVREQRLVILPIMFGEIAGPCMRDDLVGIIDDLQPDLVIHECAEFAAAPVATARGIPHVTVGFGVASSSALIEAAAIGAGELWAAESLEPSDHAGWYDHLYLHPLPRSLDVPDAATVRQVRPMHFDGADGSGEPEWVATFGRDRPGVYVTFGTEMAGLAPWTEVIEALATTEADAVVTVGSVDRMAVGPIPPNVRIETYVPQRYLLDRATVVVSHAGSGTLLAAAARGRVQLCIPLGADQWDNADALTATGAATTLEAGHRDAGTIHETLTRLLVDDETRQAAQSLAEDFTALPHPDEHLPLLEGLADVSTA